MSCQSTILSGLFIESQKEEKELLKVQKRICWIGEMILKEERNFSSISENIVKTKQCCGCQVGFAGLGCQGNGILRKKDEV